MLLFLIINIIFYKLFNFDLRDCSSLVMGDCGIEKGEYRESTGRVQVEYRESTGRVKGEYRESTGRVQGE